MTNSILLGLTFGKLLLNSIQAAQIFYEIIFRLNELGVVLFIHRLGLADHLDKVEPRAFGFSGDETRRKVSSHRGVVVVLKDFFDGENVSNCSIL